MPVIRHPSLIKWRKDTEEFNEMIEELLKYNDKEESCKELVEKWKEIWEFQKAM